MGIGLSRQLKGASKILPLVLPPRGGHLRLHAGIEDNMPQREKCPQRSSALDDSVAGILLNSVGHSHRG